MQRCCWRWPRPSFRFRNKTNRRRDAGNQAHEHPPQRRSPPLPAPCRRALRCRCCRGAARAQHGRHRLGRGPVGERLQGAGLHLHVRRQRLAEHGAADRHRLLDQLLRGAQPGAGFDRAARARHRAGDDGRRRLAHAPRRCAADHADHRAHRTGRRHADIRASPADGLAADDVQHRQAARDRRQRRPAGDADDEGAVRDELVPQARQPVLAQRPAEHLAVVQARRCDGRLGRAPGRPARGAEQPLGLHLDLGRRQRGLARRADGAAIPGQHKRRNPARRRHQRPRLQLDRRGSGAAARRQRHARRACARDRSRRHLGALDRCRDHAAHRAEGRERSALRYCAGDRHLQRGERPEAPVRQPADRCQGRQRPRAAAASGRAHDRRQQRGRRRREAAGVLRQHRRLRFARQREPQQRRPDGAHRARDALLRHHARRDGRAEQGHCVHRQRLRPHLHQQW